MASSGQWTETLIRCLVYYSHCTGFLFINFALKNMWQSSFIVQKFYTRDTKEKLIQTGDMTIWDTKGKLIQSGNMNINESEPQSILKEQTGKTSRKKNDVFIHENISHAKINFAV